MVVHRVTALFVFLLGVHVGLAAQQDADYFRSQDNNWDVSIWGGEAFGKAAGEAFGETQITMAGFRAERVIYEAPNHRKSLQYTFGVQPLFLVTRTQTAYGGGFSPVGLKWNFSPRHHGRYRPYLDFAGGGMFTQKNVPPGRTDNFNFTVSAGPGIMIALTRTQAVSLSLHYWHLSNAFLGHDNPAFNTIELEVGYHWLVGGHGVHNRQASGRRSTGGSAPTSIAGDHPSADRR